VNLRPYQVASIESIKADWQAGFTDLLAVVATGGGKTVIFLKLLDDVLQPGQRALIIAHRQELISQPYERIAQFWPHRLPHTGIVMADRNETHGQIIIATVQTLQSDKRMAQLLKAGAIDYLIVDECHHSTSASMQKVISTLKDVNPACGI
jgi:superfamily II DNA or RNA helicase